MDHEDEIDARARAMLIESVPAKWDEVRRRLALVRLYLRDADRSAAAAEAYARQAGIGRSLFYRLARVYADKAEASATGRQTDNPQPSPNITAKAIEQAGPTASPAQIFRMAVELSRTEGMAPPSRKAVRTHAAAMLAGESIAARMRLKADFAIDRAILDLDIDAGVGPSKSGQLVCIVDLNHGTIVRHHLSVGQPSSDQIVSLARFDRAASSRIALSESDAVLFAEPVRSAIAENSNSLVVGRWHVGTAIRAVVGLKIGRVALLARLPRSKERRSTVAYDTARQVVEELLVPYGGSD